MSESPAKTELETGMIISSRIGGTSGPVRGTAFPGAGTAAGSGEIDGERGRSMARNIPLQQAFSGG